MFIRVRLISRCSKGKLRDDGSADAQLHASLFLLSKGILNLFVDCLATIHTFALVGHLLLCAGYLFVVLIAVFIDEDFDAFDASLGFGQHRAGFERVKPVFEHSDTLNENLTIRWRRSGGRSGRSLSSWKLEKLQSDVQGFRGRDFEFLR